MTVGARVITALLTAPNDCDAGVATVAVPVHHVVSGVLDAAPLVAVTFLAFLIGVLV